MRTIGFVWLVLVLAIAGLRGETTLWQDGTSETRVTLFGAPWAWVSVPPLIGCFLLARRIGGAPPRWFPIATILVPLLALPAAAVWSRWYWGYWLRRPQPSASWWQLADVRELSAVQCERLRCFLVPDRPVRAAVAECRRDPYYCLGGRLLLASAPRDTPSLRPERLEAVEAALRTRAVLTPPDLGYDGNDALSGFAAFGTATDGRPLLGIAVSGGQLSNDHYPMYEVVAEIRGGATRVVRHRVFFWDFAGIEGLEFPAAAITLAAGLFVVWVPIGAVMTIRRGRGSP